MKATKTKLFLFLACIPVFIHFCLLQQTLINYPHWGDDFLFLELLDYAKSHSIAETFVALFTPHNQIHIIAWAKSIVLLSSLFSGPLNFKILTILANAQWLAILYLLYRYVKHKQYPSGHFVGIAFCLLAPFANLDSYSLLGSLSHTSSLLFMLGIAYLIETDEKKPLLVFLFMAYPLVLTEGWVMLVVGSTILLYNKHPYARIISSLSVLGLIFFAFHLSQQPSSTKFTLGLLATIPKAFFTFLGNFAWPISDSYRNLINASSGIFILFISLLFFWKQRGSRQVTRIPLPYIIWLQILATAFMVCLGRGGENLETLVLSERFYPYSTMALISTYLIVIPYFKDKVLIGFSIIYFIGSFILFMPEGQQLNSRLQSDITNAIQQDASLSYPVPTSSFRLINDETIFHGEPNDLLAIQLPKVSDDKKIEYTDNLGELKLQIEDKNQINDQRWLVIQSKAKADSIFFAPFFLDKAKKPKIIHFNSLQLTDLRRKNLWLFTKYENGKTQTNYIGSIN
ncbi:hypothetical protein [Aquirufa sp.]|jgi:hypothetical protein|uniref:hypothetical protein n=1 Tax=Aquirufa sp. TaxID=2676249 RepID=UPI0037BF4436